MLHPQWGKDLVLDDGIPWLAGGLRDCKSEKREGGIGVAGPRTRGEHGCLRQDLSKELFPGAQGGIITACWEILRLRKCPLVGQRIPGWLEVEC